MNRSYRIIWNQARQAWVVASELVKGKGKSKSSTTAQSAPSHSLKPISRLILFAALSGGIAPAFAVDTTWTNAGTSNWLTNSNWDTVAAPTSSDIVYIDNGGTAQLAGTGTANNLYIGSTATGSGSLEISSGGSLSSVESHIAWKGNTSGTAVVSGSGASWVNSGDLYVGEEGAATLTINNGGSVSFVSGYFANFVGSDGTVSVDGSGSTLTGTNLRIGGFGTGSLSISNGGVVTSVTGAIGDSSGGSGTVTVDGNGSTWTNRGFAVGRSGSGELTLSNGGVVTVNDGSNIGAGLTYIAALAGSTGTLNIGAAYGNTPVTAGTLNAGTVRFYNGTGALVFNHTETAYDFTPDIMGAGSVGLYGGTTSFSGDLSTSYTGTMTVAGGTLSIASGATLTLGGDYEQTSNGVLQVGVADDTTYGKLVVTGTATLPNNAKIDVDVTDPNFSFSTATMQDIISAGTLVSDGTFDVTDDSLLFDFDAVKDGDTVDLTLTLADSGSDSNNSDSNNSDSNNSDSNNSDSNNSDSNNSDSNNSDSTGIIETAANNTGNSPVAPVASVLDQLSAIYVNNGLTTGDDDIDALIGAIGSITNETELADAVAQTMPILVAGTAPIASGTLHATSRVVQARQSSFTGASAGDFILADKHLWVKPVGNWAEQDKRNGVSGYKADSYGFVGGIDGDINDTTKLGFALSYMNTDVKGKDTASHNTADIDAYQAIVYGSHVINNNTELNWQADIGINKNDGTRQIVIGNLSRVANADYDSYTAHLGAGIGKSFELNDKTTLIPSIRADYAYIKDESYSETGNAGGMGLNVSGATSDEFVLTAQGSLSHELNDKATLIANAGIGYDLINDQTSLTASYIGGGASFTTKGIDPSPWIGSAGAGINYNISDTSEITARYDVEGREDFLSQTASVKFRWMF